MSAAVTHPLWPWVLAAAAAAAVAALTGPHRSPRRFPDDVAADAGRRRAGPADLLRRRGPGHGQDHEPVSRSRDGRPRVPRSQRLRSRVLRSRGARSRVGRWPSGRSPSGRSRDDVAGTDLPDLATCCDLLAVSAASGSPVGAAIDSVGSVGRGPAARSLGRAAEAVRRGATVADAIDALRVDLGPDGQSLATTLAAAAGSGTAPTAALLRLADAERRRARRRVEARVRRVPVLLLVPLVGLILPAFVLLTLVPVGLSMARSAELTAPAAPSRVQAIAAFPRPTPSADSLGGPP